MRTARGPLLSAVAAIVLVGVPGVAAAQERVASPWTFRSSPAVDLWYHGLAVIGFGGPGATPYYSTAYVASVRTRKRALGLVTALDRRASRFAAAFRADTTFELLHFLPLYFPGATPERLLASLRAVSGAAGIPVVADAALTRSDSAAVMGLRAQFASPTQRALIGDYAAALSDEWTRFLAGVTRHDADTVAAYVDALQARWQDQFAPLLQPRVRALRAARVVVFLSGALGAEGRVVEAGSVVIVAVHGAPHDDISDAPLFAVVRELCFPLRQPPSPVPSDETLRLAAIDSEAAAAVRCGDDLLATAGSPLAGAYRRYLGARRP